MRRLTRLVSVVLIASILTVLLTGCTQGGIKKVIDMKYVEWKSEQPDIFFRVLDSSGSGLGYVTIDGEKIEAFFYVTFNLQLGIQLVDRDLQLLYEDKCFLPVDYKDGVITSDGKAVNIFGTEYEQIIFTKSDVDRATIDAREYYQVDWADSDNRLLFKMYYPTTWTFCGYGTALTEDGEKEITFVWGREKSFAIYLGRELSRESELVAEGTYTNNQTEAILTFTSDSLFNNQYESIKITAKKP